MFQKCHICYKYIRNATKVSEKYPKCPKCFQIVRNVPKMSEKFPKCPKCFQNVRNVPNLTELFPCYLQAYLIYRVGRIYSILDRVFSWMIILMMKVLWNTSGQTIDIKGIVCDKSEGCQVNTYKLYNYQYWLIIYWIFLGVMLI